jgi:error-prone DNA polymerase
MMHFGTWIDVKGGYFDTTHFPQTLKKHPFRGLGCYILLGQVVEDFEFLSIDIVKMKRLPMVPDPRYSEENQPSYSVWDKMKVTHSSTSRAPYPGQEELDELYGRKAISGKYDNERSNASKMGLGGRK